MFCSLHLVHKREDMVPAELNIVETMETGDIKNCVRIVGLTDEISINRIHIEEKIWGHILSNCLRSRWFITPSCFDHIRNDKCPNDSRRIMWFVASVPFWFLVRKYASENSSIVCHVPLQIFFSRYPLSLKAGTCGNWFSMHGCFLVQTELWSDQKHYIFVLIFL